MKNKDEILKLLHQTTKYPLRWVDEQTTMGDFDGREYAIDVFNIELENQLEFLKSVRPLRDIISFPITFIFHTPEATIKYYSYLKEVKMNEIMYNDVDLFLQALNGALNPRKKDRPELLFVGFRDSGCWHLLPIKYVISRRDVLEALKLLKE